MSFFRQAFRFSLGSILLFVANIILLVLLTEITKLHYLVSAVISSTVVLLLGFFIDKKLVFKSVKKTRFKHLRGYIRAHSIAGMASFAAFIALAYFISSHYVLSRVIGMALGNGAKFLLLRYKVF